MPERHSVDFARGSFNVLSDAQARTITLQFERTRGGRDPIDSTIRRVLKALDRRHGGGITSRLNRWMRGEGNPLVLPARPVPHPENPDVLCFEIGVRPGERMDSALAGLLDFLRQQPGYERTYGPPLDRDDGPRKVRGWGSGNAAASAQMILERLFKIRRR
jgi:hypothetical protein